MEKFGVGVIGCIQSHTHPFPHSYYHHHKYLTILHWTLADHSDFALFRVHVFAIKANVRFWSSRKEGRNGWGGGSYVLCLWLCWSEGPGRLRMAPPNQGWVSGAFLWGPLLHQAPAVAFYDTVWWKSVWAVKSLITRFYNEVVQTEIHFIFITFFTHPWPVLCWPWCWCDVMWCVWSCTFCMLGECTAVLLCHSQQSDQ